MGHTFPVRPVTVRGAVLPGEHSDDGNTLELRCADSVAASYRGCGSREVGLVPVR